MKKKSKKILAWYENLITTQTWMSNSIWIQTMIFFVNGSTTYALVASILHLAFIFAIFKFSNTYFFNVIFQYVTMQPKVWHAHFVKSSKSYLSNNILRKWPFIYYVFRLFWPPPPCVSINTVQKLSKTCHFLTPSSLMEAKT